MVQRGYSTVPPHVGLFTLATRKQESKKMTFAKFQAIITNIPYQTGIVPEHWKDSTNVMLIKKPGNYNAEG